MAGFAGAAAGLLAYCAKADNYGGAPLQQITSYPNENVLIAELKEQLKNAEVSVSPLQVPTST
jgi:hypothetical protein